MSAVLQYVECCSCVRYNCNYYCFYNSLQSVTITTNVAVLQKPILYALFYSAVVLQWF